MLFGEESSTNASWMFSSLLQVGYEHGNLFKKENKKYQQLQVLLCSLKKGNKYRLKKNCKVKKFFSVRKEITIFNFFHSSHLILLVLSWSAASFRRHQIAKFAHYYLEQPANDLFGILHLAEAKLYFQQRNIRSYVQPSAFATCDNLEQVQCCCNG